MPGVLPFWRGEGLSSFNWHFSNYSRGNLGSHFLCGLAITCAEIIAVHLRCTCPC